MMGIDRGASTAEGSSIVTQGTERSDIDDILEISFSSVHPRRALHLVRLATSPSKSFDDEKDGRAVPETQRLRILIGSNLNSSQ